MIHTLDVAYEKCQRHVDSATYEERLRHWKLKNLLLEDDLADLHDQVSEDDARIDQLESKAQDLQCQREEAIAEAEQLKAELRSKARETDSLEAGHFILA